MCGIFCYVCHRKESKVGDIVDRILSGLRLLEYRGYDSAGMCLHTDGVQHIVKAVGTVDHLADQVHSQVDLNRTVNTQCAIAHTRWATHGAPSIVNGHPHVSDAALSFVVVHNGVITNYDRIKQTLEDTGVTFDTDTDTEVIPKLCLFVWQELARSTTPSFMDVVSRVLPQLEGTYALAIVSSRFPNELIACKRGSSLILGLPACYTGKEDDSMECWIASDAVALARHTNHVLFLEDHDIVHIKNGAYAICNTQHTPVARALECLDIHVHETSKGSYPHYMLKEIHEQRQSILQTMRGRVWSPTGTLSGVKLGGIEPYIETIRRSQRIILFGCGTSYHACVCVRGLLEDMGGVPVMLELATDFCDRRPPLSRNDTCVFVSQSGETADTLSALEYAKACGALCVGITNVAGSALARKTHCGIHQNAGCEIGVASTKAYTSQIVCLVMMSLLVGSAYVRNTDTVGTIFQCMRDELPDKIQEVLGRERDYTRIASQLAQDKSILFIARGNDLATAMEACLKLKEVGLVHSEAISAGELKHGPLALIDESFPVVAIATKGKCHGKMMSALEQLSARNGKFYVMQHDRELAMGRAQDTICVPDIHEALQPILNIIPFQFIAYHLAIKKGLDVDKPRNLAKSVTVSD